MTGIAACHSLLQLKELWLTDYDHMWGPCPAALRPLLNSHAQILKENNLQQDFAVVLTFIIFHFLVISFMLGVKMYYHFDAKIIQAIDRWGCPAHHAAMVNRPASMDGHIDEQPIPPCSPHR